MEGDRGRVSEAQILAGQLADREFGRSVCGALVSDVSESFGFVASDHSLGDPGRGNTNSGLHHLS